MSDETLNQFVKRKRREAAEERMFQMPDPLPDQINNFVRQRVNEDRMLFAAQAAPLPSVTTDLTEAVASGITRQDIGLAIDLLPQLQTEPQFVFPPIAYPVP